MEFQQLPNRVQQRPADGDVSGSMVTMKSIISDTEIPNKLFANSKVTQKP